VLDWVSVTIGGHSQGAGHAVYIAKELRRVRRVCAFAGPRDSSANGQLADWIASPSRMTPVDAWRALVHENDPSVTPTTAAYAAFGMVKDTQWRLITGALSDPHNYVVQAPEVSGARVWSCFE
jgi:pimeloyl-ACP methyl ester carboxylesterase